MHNVEYYSENRDGISLIAKDKTLKNITYKEIDEKTEENLNIDSNTLRGLSSITKPYKLMTEMQS